MNAHVARFLAVVALATVAFTRSADANARLGGTLRPAEPSTTPRPSLTWQQGGPRRAPTPGAGAKAYCAGLKPGRHRLAPSDDQELQTIVEDSSRRNPSIDTTAFPRTPADWFWSSSAVGRLIVLRVGRRLRQPATRTTSTSLSRFRLVRCVR